VTLRDLLIHRESLAALSGVGYRAYVAAFLVASAEDTDDAAELVDYVLFSLAVPDTQPEADEARARLAALGPDQRDAIRGWLDHVCAQFPRAAAISL
jgi:hypothetical protein